MYPVLLLPWFVRIRKNVKVINVFLAVQPIQIVPSTGKCAIPSLTSVLIGAHSWNVQIAYTENAATNNLQKSANYSTTNVQIQMTPVLVDYALTNA